MPALQSEDFSNELMRFVHILARENNYGGYTYLIENCINREDYFKYCQALYIKLYGALTTDRSILYRNVYGLEYDLYMKNRYNGSNNLKLLIIHDNFTPMMFTDKFYNNISNVKDMLVLAIYYPPDVHQIIYNPFQLPDLRQALNMGFSPQKGLLGLYSADASNDIEESDEYPKLIEPTVETLIAYGAEFDDKIVEKYLKDYSEILDRNRPNYIFNIALNRVFFLYVSPFTKTADQTQIIDILLTQTAEYAQGPDDIYRRVIKHLESYDNIPWSLNNRQFETAEETEFVNFVIYKNVGTLFSILPIEILEYIMSLVIVHKINYQENSSDDEEDSLDGG